MTSVSTQLIRDAVALGDRKGRYLSKHIVEIKWDGDTCLCRFVHQATPPIILGEMTFTIEGGYSHITRPLTFTDKEYGELLLSEWKQAEPKHKTFMEDRS